MSGCRRIASAIGRIASVLPVPVPATMPKPLPDAASVADLLAVLPLEQRVQMQAQRELDGLAGGARGGDDDDAPGGMGRVAVGVGIGRKVMVAGAGA